MKPAKPHLLIRLIDGIADRAFKTAVLAGPAIGGAVLAVAAQRDAEDDSPDALTTFEYPDGTPFEEAVEHDQWAAYWGKT